MASDGFTTVRISNPARRRAERIMAHLRESGIYGLTTDQNPIIARRGATAGAVVEMALIALEAQLGVTHGLTEKK